LKAAFSSRSSLLAAVGLALAALLIVWLSLRPGLVGNGRAHSAGQTCGDSDTPYVEVQTDPGTSARIDLQVARTRQEHEVGLMYREYLPPDSGMLFVYDAQAREGYWMYHTLVSLSIAWIDRDGTIVDIQDMPRLNNPDDVQEASRHVYNPAAPYWYALEVNQGWFSDRGVGVGQQISFCLGDS
jgi:uncharacterized membrane protein (UPF0127 family)